MPWKNATRAGATVHLWNGYSLAERERRWNAVRAGAAKAGFDCILVPLGNGIDGRYMTQLRCSATALPSDGRPPIVVADRSSHNEWVAEPWQTGREWAEPMAEALLDLGMERGRIGVVGLRGGLLTHCHSIDGVVNHTALEYVIGRLPSARFEDATDIVGLVRYVKSEEELAFVRQSAAVACAGLDELIKLAKPGVDAGALYAGVLARMLELRSEYFPLALTIDEPGAQHPRRYINPPLGRRLEPNALITSEINAVRGAQLTQVCQPVLLGKMPQEWKPVIELHREVYERGLKMIKPGATFGALKDSIESLGAKAGMKAVMQLHGCGYGDDGPLFSAKAGSGRARDLTIQAGNALVWKPAVTSADGKIHFTWGGPVMVMEQGCEMLFHRPHGMVEIG
jgi:Xaa-Pro aminopeptidase